MEAGGRGLIFNHPLLKAARLCVVFFFFGGAAVILVDCLLLNLEALCSFQPQAHAGLREKALATQETPPWGY